MINKFFFFLEYLFFVQYILQQCGIKRASVYLLCFNNFKAEMFVQHVMFCLALKKNGHIVNNLVHLPQCIRKAENLLYTLYNPFVDQKKLYNPFKNTLLYMISSCNTNTRKSMFIYSSK